MNTAKGTFYIVATPIGNLEDMSQRARHVLANVDLILAEDTRHSKKLLNAYQITTPMKSHHAHNEAQQIDFIMEKLLHGNNIALISDAGTPLISDPGQLLVAALREANFSVVPIPGPCALIAALSAAGLPSHGFIFDGFLSVKTHARETQLQSLLREPRTLIFYEAPHRIVDFCQSLQKIFGDERRLVIARELTKIHETFLAGSIADVVVQVTTIPQNQLGEFVILLEGAEEVIDQHNPQVNLDALLTCLLSCMPLKQAASQAAALTGLKKNALYQRALTLIR